MVHEEPLLYSKCTGPCLMQHCGHGVLGLTRRGVNTHLLAARLLPRGGGGGGGTEGKNKNEQQAT